MDEDSSRPSYVERKGGGLHPAKDRKRLNMIIYCYGLFTLLTLYLTSQLHKSKKRLKPSTYNSKKYSFTIATDNQGPNGGHNVHGSLLLLS